MDAKQIERNIIPSIEPLGEGASEDRNLYYEAPNGRRFNIRDYGEPESIYEKRYFLEEYVPTLCEPDKLGINDWIRMFHDDPNSFQQKCELVDIDPEDIICVGGGKGLGSKYYDSLEEVAVAIGEALESNQWYKHHDPELARMIQESPEYKQMQEIEAWADAEQRRLLHEEAMQERGIFKGAHNMWGPLPDDTKFKILSYINEPTEQKWNNIYTTLITPSITLWQAWIAVDPRAPYSVEGEKWPNIPSGERLKQAIQYFCLLSDDEEQDEDSGFGPR